MSEADRRLRVVAIGFAAAALLVALVAVVIVVRREAPTGAAQKTSEKPAVAPLVDRKVLASDVIKLQHDAVDVVIESGQTKGVRVKDSALSAALGLETGDVIVSMSGRPLVRELDIYDAVFNLSMMNATIMYVELLHDNAPLLARWQLDGDLRKARYAANGSTLGSYGSFGSLGSTPALPPDPPDPLLDTIVMTDDTHVTIPKKTVDHLLADPLASMKSARVVPAIKNGQPDGFKLYAIRPSSALARLGFQNGDTVQTVNGKDLSTPDKALEMYTSLRGAKGIEIDLVRRGKPIHLSITITK